MDQLPEQASASASASGGLDDSPASRVKGRTRGNRSRRDLGRPAAPRAARRARANKRAPTRAETAAPEGAFQASNDTMVAAATGTQPSRLLPFAEPIGSWHETVNSPPPQKLSVSQNPLGIFGIPYEEPSFLTPSLESPANNGSYSTPGSSRSESIRKEIVGGVYQTNVSSMNSSSKKCIMRNPMNGKWEINTTSSAASSRPSSSLRDANFRTPSSMIPSIISSPFTTRNGSTASLEMAYEELEPGVTEWKPAGLLCKGNEEPENKYALLILNQPIENINLLKLVWEKGE